jgi:hypothetical protein
MFKKDENQMNAVQNKTCKLNMFTQKLALIFMLMTASTMSAAELKWIDSDQDSEAEVAYVDSVKKWGAWELDIEPAAGGLTAPSTGALNPRDSRVALRTNSISALAPPSSAKPTVITQSPIMPPVVPTAPPAPPAPALPPAPGNFAPPGATPPVVVTLP